MAAIRQRIGRLVPPDTKTALRRRMREAELRWARWRWGLRGEDVAPFLARLGVREGDVLCVHSSFDALASFEGASPLAVVRMLQRTVGQRGTLIMPTLPFEGSAIEYAAGDPVFDVRQTPSRMGLLSELFRRMPGVRRSLHPTHSAAVWGARAEAMTADHHRAETPCGRPSPYAGLLDHEGRILFLGVDVSAMTFFHTAEELLEARMPFAPFTHEVYRLRSRDADGTLVETRTRLFAPAVAAARERFEAALEPRMRRRGTWHEGRLGPLRAVLLEARDVLAALREAVE